MRIRILDTWWNVYFIDPQDDIFLLPNGVDRTVGVTDISERTIYIADNLDKEFEREVFLHEYCHASSFVSGLNLSEKSEECLCMWVGKNT